MEKITSLGKPLLIGSVTEVAWEKYLPISEGQKVMVLVDENTLEDCLPHLVGTCDLFKHAEVLELPAGEETKQMDYCMSVYQTLFDYEFGRGDLLFALGGGVIVDMGGFIAATFKRGMNFISVPTSLLSMVDASVGGKTGVDFGEHKNMIGLFSIPELICIDKDFLGTLPEKELFNGLAEMLKHGLIDSREHFEKVKDCLVDTTKINSKLIQESISLKNKIVEADPKEKGERKKLNFGHTIGHAIESFCLSKSQVMDHGLAVIHGILVESNISLHKGFIRKEEFREIEKTCKQYSLRSFTQNELQEILAYTKNDKKNEDGKVLFTLLKELGKSLVNQEVEEGVLMESLKIIQAN
jgi:3-dehydroquinate synthase